MEQEMSWDSISHKTQVTIKFSARALDFNLVKSELGTCHAQSEQSDSSYYFHTRSLYSFFYKLHQTLLWKQHKKNISFFFFSFQMVSATGFSQNEATSFYKGRSSTGDNLFLYKKLPCASELFM